MIRSDSTASPKKAARRTAVRIVQLLQESGHKAYLAGGCVRDELLGLAPKDFDVATDAYPERVCELFPRSRYVGESFGVVRVHQKGCEHVIEVATFRKEWGYLDGRRPSGIQYTDARSDAQRRDFTINALFLDPLVPDKDQQIIDFVDGQKDLRDRLIRAVGDAQSRLSEDYLRLLRAVRFASRLNFQIEPQTANAIRLHAKDLGQISRQRIGQEVMWMLTPGVLPGAANTTVGVDGRSAQAIQLIQDLGLDGSTFSEDHIETPLVTVTRLIGGNLSDHGQIAVSGTSLPEGSNSSRSVGYPTILAAWLLDRHLFGQPTIGSSLEQTTPVSVDPAHAIQGFVDHQVEPIVQRWRQSICLSNENRNAIRRVLELLCVALSWSSLGVAKRKRLMAEALWSQVYALVEAVSGSDAVSLDVCLALIQRDRDVLIAQGVAPSQWITGEDLIALGRKPGPEFRRILDAVYDAQLDGSVTSRQEALGWVRDQA